MTTFLIITFAVSWVLWLPMLQWVRKTGRLGAPVLDAPLAGLPMVVGASWYLGASAPSVVALILSGREGALDDLLHSLVEWNVGIGWNVLTLVGPLAIGLVAMAMHAARGTGGVRLALRRLPLVPVAILAAIPFGPLGEELGWRGYLLPRLLDTTSGVAAALLVGVIWALWHVPLFWAPLGTSVSRTGRSARSVGRFFVEVTSMSVILTWLFVETDGSLWAALLLHAAWNADAHRFFFAPLDDETSDRVTSLITAGYAMAAIALVVWPGLDWRT